MIPDPGPAAERPASGRRRARWGRRAAAPAAIEVAAGLVFRAGRLLIAQRRRGGHLGGLWEFPGGKRRRGERWRACLQRELREELGVEVRVGAMIEEVTHIYPEQAVRLRFFSCRWREGDPEARGCRAFVWVRPHELAGYTFPAADARLLARLQCDGGLWPPA